MKNQPIDFETVLKLYHTHCVKNNFIPDQPSQAESKEGSKYFYLNNCNGLIAKFNKREKVFN